MTVLSGIRVVELAGLGPAPFACMLLSDLGADVIRVDRRPGKPASGITTPLDRGRRSIVVDLKNPQGVEVVLSLAATADVLIEPFRPGVAERLGIGPVEVMRRNERLVYGRMTGWGQEGPLATTAGHDINYIALSGVLGAIGRRGEAPVPPLNLIGDFGGGGMLIAFGVLAALLERATSGRGQVVDAAMVDGSATLMAVIFGMWGQGTWLDERGTNVLDGGAPFYDTYLTADNEYLAVGALEPQFYAEVLRGLGLDGADLPGQYERSRWPELRALFAAEFRRRSRADWMRHFEGSDACVTPVLSMSEAVAHPHNVSREVFCTVDGIDQPVPVPRFSRTPSPTPTSPPRIGAHTEEVLAGAGYSTAEIESLAAAGVVTQAECDS